MEIEYILSDKFKASDISDSKELKECFGMLCQEYGTGMNEGQFQLVESIIRRLIELGESDFKDEMDESTEMIFKVCLKNILQDEAKAEQTKIKAEPIKKSVDKFDIESLPTELISKSGKKYILMNTSNGGLCLNKKI